jgi:hypothetical protein
MITITLTFHKQPPEALSMAQVRACTEMGKRVKIGQFNDINFLIINTPSFSSLPKSTLFAKPSFHCCPSLPGLHLGNDSLLQLCVHLGHLAGKDFITQRLVNVLHNF